MTAAAQPVHTRAQHIDSQYGPTSKLKELVKYGYGVIIVYNPSGFSHAIVVCIRGENVFLLEPNSGGYLFPSIETFISWVKMYITSEVKTKACMVLGFQPKSKGK